MTALEIQAVEPVTLPIASIKLDPELQCRASGINKRTVAEYAESMRNGAAFPAVVVFKDKQDVYWLADGFQRCAAAASISDTAEILADVREGSRRDALIFAGWCERDPWLAAHECGQATRGDAAARGVPEVERSTYLRGVRRR